MRTPTAIVRRAFAAAPVVSLLLGGGGGVVGATSEPPSSGAEAAASDEFCAAAWQIRAAAGAIDELVEDPDAGADAVREAYVQLATATADASAAAPPELVDGLDLLAGQAGVALAVVEANHFDLAATNDDPRWQALSEFDQLAELPALQAEVETYVDTYCDAPTAPTAAPGADETCVTLADFEAATDAFGEVLADETSGPDELQQSFTDYFAEIDRLVESGPESLSAYLAEWRGVMESFEDLLERNDWNLLDTLSDPQNLEIQEDISTLGSESAPDIDATHCDEASDATAAAETTEG